MQWNTATMRIVLVAFAIALLMSYTTLKAATVIDIRKKLPRHASKKFARRSLSQIDQVVLHHTAGRIDETPEEIAAYHVGPNHISSTGTPGISYTLVIDAQGRIYWCNDIESITWHVSNENTHSVSICVIGNYETRQPNAKQVAAVKRAKRWLEKKIGRKLPMVGHSKAGTTGTECPGDNLRTAFKLEK